MLSDEWLSRYGLLENFNESVTRTRTGTGTWTTGVTAIALCTSCSRAKNSLNDHLGPSNNLLYPNLGYNEQFYKEIWCISIKKAVVDSFPSKTCNENGW